jgi:hypothetical protein
MVLMLRLLYFFVCVLLVSISSASTSASVSGAAPLELRIAVVTDGRAGYFIRLLEESLKLIHQPYRIQYVKDIPARRMWWMLGQGDINLFYGMRSKDKDGSEQLVVVRNALTNGLVGRRVLLIRRGDAEMFAQVRSVEDLKRTKLIAGFGAGWGDVKVWETAGLPLYEHTAPWNTIYAMVAAENRNVDYLPRSVIEAVDEARAHPELVVEPHLLMDYKGDFAYYLTASAASYRPIIERALKEADATGLKARLIDETFGADIKALNLNRRLRLPLSAPSD